MAIADYAHWNEEAELVWWLEEGRHGTYEEPYEDDPDAGWDDWEDDEEEVDEPADADLREDFGWAGDPALCGE
jgi:hypothetical protein